ncbi:hypothetical protein CHUAL_007845 [Chamberlinius hualienensis]
MAPYLEEVDVFTIPHSRMKQLVHGYCTKLSLTDFASYEATNALLRSLYSTFREFKSHETIENVLIMRKLKTRLQTIPFNEPNETATVCNCHSDNRLAEMLQLVSDGYALSNDRAERIDYGKRLVAALHEFTSNFIPHMEEEEEIFQPMLVKYFEYEELRNLKKKVIEQHEKLVKDLADDNQLEKFRLEEEEHDAIDCDTDDENYSLEIFPAEIVLKIFSYLSPPDLGRCARVCSRWRSISRQPVLWRKILPVQWAKDDWVSSHGNYYPQDHPSYWKLNSSGCYLMSDVARMMDPETDSDFDERDDGSRVFYGKELKNYRREEQMVENISEYLLPHVGTGVTYLSLAGCELLESKWLSPFLVNCPNLVHLDLSYTWLYDEIVQISLLEVREQSKGNELPSCPKLAHLNLTGCDGLSDTGFFKLMNCLFSSSKSDKVAGGHLKVLNLSGCLRLTDETLKLIMKTSIPNALCELDLSGCWIISGPMLCQLTEACPNLDPQRLSYCDLIVDGPYQKTANGCQNLANGCLFCCCTALQ